MIRSYVLLGLPDYEVTAVEEVGGEIRMSVRSRRRLGQGERITEGFHTKMKVLQRQAHGFRNYRLRVRVMCS